LSEDARSSEAADVLRRVENGVLWITLNRPDAGNAMKAEMRNQIADWLDEISGSYTVRAVVITGAGEKGFCTGADLRGGRTQPPAMVYRRGLPADDRPIAPSDVATAINDLFDRQGVMPRPRPAAACISRSRATS